MHSWLLAVGGVALGAAAACAILLPRLRRLRAELDAARAAAPAPDVDLAALRREMDALADRIMATRPPET